ncbi:nuclear transport factor 2 family protein [Amycolatopsis rhabdoformis]|uniref:Nuclear transport factor 2 family protein n=1 Tax=Amycolatopsis rhabdoformis TaxID=1448059 RepID=A0ABZ1IFV0_9PSEU|nr:nuclear transport factor 2 family protein [Amycolatopsis rhabdoformis]WSE32419.1 nuclear transport factor 2 family protein [Amycolatopsis rhabdoformis]
MPETSTNIAVVDAFFRAVERGDLDAARALYAPDARIWHNDGAGEQDRDANLAVFQLFSTAIRGLRFDVSRRVDAGDGVLQQHVLRGQLPNGEEAALEIAMYLAVGGGRITRIEEYFDVATVTHIITTARESVGA